MNSVLLLGIVGGYFAILLVVAYFTSRKSDNDSFFIGNKNSNWMLVAFGMIGTSLSGVTFVSVPGTVGNNGFQYFQVAIGYFIGYFIVAFVLLPLYYRTGLTSIYSYLMERFGMISYKTGASFFIISRTLGATARLYLVVNILQIFILNRLNVPFWITVLVILTMILLYTVEGGVKTIVYTDTLQTLFMLSGLIICLVYIVGKMDMNYSTFENNLSIKNLNNIFNTDFQSPQYFFKQIFSGMLITIGMTGLDQEMMQKNISIKRLTDSQRNMMIYSFVILIVNFVFLTLGGAMYLYKNKLGIEAAGDDLFPTLALTGYLPSWIGLVFIIALISALFPSADGALTALTSSFSLDILGMKRNKNLSDNKKVRMFVHLSFTIIFFIIIMIFKSIDNKSIIDLILKIAGYTYGPLLGLFLFGLTTKYKIRDNLTIIIAAIAPILTYLVDVNSGKWFDGFNFGFMVFALNAGMTYLGLLLIRKQ